jgi:hypothetical protein
MAMKIKWVTPVLREGQPDGKVHIEKRLTGYTLCGIGPVLGWTERQEPSADRKCEKCVAEMVIRKLTRKSTYYTIEQMVQATGRGTRLPEIQNIPPTKSGRIPHAAPYSTSPRPASSTSSPKPPSDTD